MGSSGCGRPTTLEDDRPPPFSFRALDLQQQTTDGKPAWSLVSPEARYDIRSSVARALRPEGVIFAKGKPLYKLGATTGTVINDGEVILLEGAIRLLRLGASPLLITADRALWIPRESLMRFELAPRVRNRQSLIRSQTATLHLDQDLLKLRGNPTLLHWSRPMALSAPTSPQPPEMQGTVKEVDWRPGSGELSGAGPLTILRRPPGRRPDRPLQRLTATRLQGNTQRQEYTLQGPVRIDDPAEESWFRGGEVRFHAKEQWLRSGAPFEAKKGAVEVRGNDLRLDGLATLATIGANCALRQGGEALQAQRCEWNWQSQAMAAQGGVELRRQANDQLTRAERLEGQLGANGRLLLSTPGGRVISQLRVPRQARPPQPQKPRPKPEPIVF